LDGILFPKIKIIGDFFLHNDISVKMLKIIAFTWQKWGIVLTDFTMGSAIGFFLLIPFIIWSSNNREREQKQGTKVITTNIGNLQETRIIAKTMKK